MASLNLENDRRLIGQKETIDKLSNNIHEWSAQLKELFSKVEKQLAIFLDASEASKTLSEKFSEFAKNCLGQYPLLSKCLNKAGMVTAAMSHLTKVLSMEWSETLIQPMNQILKVEMKEVKRKKKIFDKSFAAYDLAKMKVKQCREKGSQTNMIKLIELENERESLRKKCEIKTLDTITKCEIFFEKMEVETSFSIYNFIHCYQRFNKNAHQMFSNLDTTMSEFRQTIDDRKSQLDEKVERGNKELEDLGGEIVPFLIQNPELRDTTVSANSLAPIQYLNPDEQYFFNTPAQFAVTKIGKSKGEEMIQVVLSENPAIVSAYHLKDQHSTSRPVTQLLQVYKSNKNNRKLNMQWVDKDKPVKYIFIDSEQRERFYEILSFASNVAKNSDTPKTEEKIEIFIGSWNMGDAPPPLDPEELGKWIPKSGYDIYAIGVQECEYKTKGEEESSSLSCEADWFSRVQDHLGFDYIKVFGLSLMSIRLIVLVHRDHYFKISHIKKGSEATGIANIVGNKGAVGVSFQFNQTRICFVNSHLAAHQSKVDDRNQNYRQIVQNLHIQSDTVCCLSNYFHYLFWFGDLNYRLQADRDEVIAKIKAKQYEDLRTIDQLNIHRVWGNTFAGFNEGILSFPPTYRYIRGIREYNDEKLRIPSWCDRILWRTLPNCEIKQNSYQSCDEIMTSDHSPIQSTFSIISKTAIWPWVPKLPFPPKIIISDIEATGVYTTSFSDITFTFFAPFFKESVTSNPVPFKENKYQVKLVNPIEIFNASPQFLQNEHIFVSLKEQSKKKELIENGQCAISLANACGAEPAYFDCKLLCKKEGKLIGKLTGKIFVSWDRDKSAEVSYSRDAFIQKKGYLMKQGRHRKTWARRWCVLLNRILFYYPNETTTKQLSSVPIKNCLIAVQEADRQNVFTIETQKRTYFFCANTAEEMTDWVKELKIASGYMPADPPPPSPHYIHNALYSGGSPTLGLSSGSNPGSLNSSANSLNNSGGSIPNSNNNNNNNNNTEQKITMGQKQALSPNVPKRISTPPNNNDDNITTSSSSPSWIMKRRSVHMDDNGSLIGRTNNSNSNSNSNTPSPIPSPTPVATPIPTSTPSLSGSSGLNGSNGSTPSWSSVRNNVQPRGDRLFMGIRISKSSTDGDELDENVSNIPKIDIHDDLFVSIPDDIMFKLESARNTPKPTVPVVTITEPNGVESNSSVTTTATTEENKEEKSSVELESSSGSEEEA